MTERVFLSGRLCDPELFEIVTGSPLSGQPATLSGADASGGLLVSVDADVKRRLAFYLPDTGDETAKVMLQDGASVLAFDYSDRSASIPLDGWQVTLERLVAAEYMQLIGSHSHKQAQRTLPQIRMRAASRLRAQSQPSPSTLKPVTNTTGVQASMTRQPYTDFFAVREDDLTFPLFSGGKSPQVRRASFLGGDAVTVLPYDPRADSILVVRQFRHGPYVRGDTNPWTLEPAAGRIDPGEDPENTARRELQEETGVQAGGLHLVGRYYPTPGAFSEYIYSYVAPVDLSGRDGGIGGLDDEAEDIMAHVLRFESAMEMIDTGEINTAPLILSLQWLAINRGSL